MRHITYRLDEHGEPKACNLEEFICDGPFEDEKRIVAQETVGSYFVSTVFLTVNHQHSVEGIPILWETMVFGKGPLEGECTRCGGSREQALAMHAQMLARVKENP